MMTRSVQCLLAEAVQENLQEVGVTEEVGVALILEQEGQELLGQEMAAVWSHEVILHPSTVFDLHLRPSHACLDKVLLLPEPSSDFLE